jgi:Flp pilus assembly protein TadG
MKRGPFLRRRERGAIAVAYLLMSTLLLGFVGLGLDVGRIYIAKTELQNASDACALAASAALTGANIGQLLNAEALGITAGARNLVAMQTTPATVAPDADITFSTDLNGVYNKRSLVANSAILNQRFVRCVVTEANINSMLLKVVDLLPGATPLQAQTIQAGAVASLLPSLSHCAIPIASCVTSSSPPNFGLVPGNWYRGKLNAGNAQMSGGAFRWVSFPGATSGVPGLRDLLAGSGQCNLNAATQVASQNGQISSLSSAFNGRFGLYQGGNPSNLEGTPDATGYSYFPPVTPGPLVNEYTPAASAMPDFQIKRATNTAFANITNFSIKPGWNNISGTGPSPSHQALGGDRRLVVMPMTNCSTLSGSAQPMVGWACFLMLHPIFNPNDDMWLEFRGNAASISSGCVTSGLPGGPGAGGPKVPGLAQ